MAIDNKSALTVAAAFAAAMLAAPASHADSGAAIATIESTADATLEPSKAALQKLEEATQVAWWWGPFFPPKFIDLWPEVVHVEAIRTA